MTLSPTLQCPCKGVYLREAFFYDRRPREETSFDFGATPYRRAYDGCELCGHYFSRHEMDLAALYDRDYVDSTYGGVEGMRAQLEKILALPSEHSDNSGRVRRIVEYARLFFQGRPTVKRLLDIGAGIGVFPGAMKKIGWQVSTVEPDIRTAAHLRETVGVEAFADNLLNLDPDTTGHFDVVTFNKVLEHVEDPVALLARGAVFLKPKGFVYVELPDVAAAVDGPDREEFFIEHHHVFSPQSFAMLAANAGLSLQAIERLREPSGKYTLRGFLCKGGATL